MTTTDVDVYYKQALLNVTVNLENWLVTDVRAYVDMNVSDDNLADLFHPETLDRLSQLAFERLEEIHSDT